MNRKGLIGIGIGIGVVAVCITSCAEEPLKTRSFLVGLSFMEHGAGTLTNCLDTDKDPTNDWTNKDAQEKYKHVALTLCKNYKTKYVALTIEVNTYYQHPQGSKEDFNRSVKFYIKGYDELKKECPDTKIFVTFQLEELKGRGDASWGYDVEPAWELLELFDGRLDVIAFTTYPFPEYTVPEDIPDDYYTSIIDDLPEQYKTTDLVLFLQRIKSTCFSALLWTYSGIFSIVDRKLVKILRAAGVFEV